MTPLVAGPVVSPLGQAPAAPTPAKDPRLEKAAREFESIFIRQMLKTLEKAGEATGGGHSVSSGGSVYGSMMIGSLADAASSGGGIGLGHLVLEALTRAPQKSK